MANKIRGFITLTGGGTGALDAISGSLLTDGDMAVGVVNGIAYEYRLDATLGGSESSPRIIAPDTNPGNKRWVMTTIPNNYEYDALAYGDTFTKATISAALVVIAAATSGTTPATLLLQPGTWVIAAGDADLIIPANVTLKMPPGAIIDIDVLRTLTISGPLEAGLRQTFDGSGSVKFTRGAVKCVYPQWWGALGNAVHDDTAAIQAAIDSTVYELVTWATNEGTSYRNIVRIPTGSYIFGVLTISHPVKIMGDGMFATVLRTTEIGDNAIDITSEIAVEISDLAIGSTHTVQTGGSLVRVLPATNYNQFSKFTRVAFNNAFTALRLDAAAFVHVSHCYFNRYSTYGILLQNTLTPDAGDNVIENSVFNNGSGAAIYHASSGGLRVQNNKFLGGTAHYQSYYDSGASSTGILLIQGNSFDQATTANIIFNSNATNHSQIIITGNHFTILDGKLGISCNALGYNYLYGLSIGSNVFQFKKDGTGISLNGTVDSSIYPNHFWGDSSTGTTVGINFGDGTGPNLVHPQTMQNIDTFYTGVAASERFIPGGYVTYAGDPNNNVTPNYIGELCLDTSNNKWYKAFGLVGNQWAALN